MEQGPHFIHGDNQKDMLEISPDGFIAMPKDGMENAFGDVTGNLAIKIKCLTCALQDTSVLCMPAAKCYESEEN